MSVDAAVPSARRPSTSEVLRPVVPLLAAVAVLMVANGLQSSLVVLRATSEGFGGVATGAIASAYFAGFLVGARVSTDWISRVGHVRAFAAFASIASMMVLLHVLVVNVPTWFVARLLTGVCVSGLLVVIESWLNTSVDNTSRGRVLSVYMVVNMGGYALGQVLLAFFPVESFELFAVVSVLLSTALIPPILSRRSNPRIVTVTPMPMQALARRTPGGVVASVMSGLTWGVIAGWSAVIAAAVGQRGIGITVFVGSFLVGHLLTEPLVGMVSDRTDRRLVLFLLASAATGAAVAGALAGPRLALLLPLGLVIGGTTLPMYSLSIALAGDRLVADESVAAAGALVRINGLGAAAGPIIASIATRGGSVAAFYWVLAVATAVTGLVALGLLWRSGYRPPRVPYLPLVTRATAGMSVAALRPRARRRGARGPDDASEVRAHRG